VIFNQSLFNGAKKVVVQASINDANNDFRCSIPISVDGNEAVLYQQTITYGIPSTNGAYTGIGGGLR
jgi:hypothetical protein